MSDLQEAKEKYYNWKKECDNYFNGVVPEIGDYIKGLEKMNEEMLDALIYCVTDEDWDAYIILDIIEKATGQKIEEILKDA